MNTKQEGNNGEMNDELLSELIRNSRDTNQKVGEMHTTIFGAHGQGGLIREHHEFKTRTEAELEALRKHREEINLFKAKLVAVVAFASAVASFFGSKLATLVSKLP